LQSVTDAVNHGAIFKFLTKPWEDEELLKTLQEAFREFEINLRSGIR
jgi:FixJ family two-component response regulator